MWANCKVFAFSISLRQLRRWLIKEVLDKSFHTSLPETISMHKPLNINLDFLEQTYTFLRRLWHWFLLEFHQWSDNLTCLACRVLSHPCEQDCLYFLDLIWSSEGFSSPQSVRRQIWVILESPVLSWEQEAVWAVLWQRLSTDHFWRVMRILDSDWVEILICWD